MAEILTESFCERCGTRYTFEAATPKKHRIGRLKVLSKGLKNYVLSDDASLDEALADARSEEERELSGGQLDAFHQTFQFCMSCRQYTCSNCWNEAEGRCLSCAPLSFAGGAQLGSPLDDLLARGGMAPLLNPATIEGEPAQATNGATNGQHAVDEPGAANGSAWPTIDLFRAAEGSPTPEAAGTVPEAVAELLPEAAATTEPEPAAGAGPEAVAATVDSGAAPAEAGLSEPSAFWTKPFTGFAPVAEPTNGHGPAPALPEPGPEAPASVEAAVETADAPAVEAEIAAVVPEPVEAEAQAVEPIEAAEAAAVVEPVVSAEPVQAPAPDVDPAAEARAMELAERTTRLLGRLRVQPRSAGSAPAATPADDQVLAPAASQAPPAPPAPVAVRPAASWPRLQPQPSRTPVPPPAVSPEPVDQPTLTPFDKLVERPAPPAWMQAAVPAVPVGPAPEPVTAAAPPPIAEPTPEPIVEAPVEVVAPPAPAAPDPLPAAATDRVEMPAWPRLVRPPLSDSPPVQAPPAPMPAQAPQWPAPLQPGYDASSTPFWASGENDRKPGELDVWTASAREVAEAPGQVAGVQSCIKCGLSLSATARFCRRCGSRQG